MSGALDPTPLERARAASSRGAWQEAYDLLVDADARGLLGPADLPLLADVAYAAGHLDVTIEVWERAHGECVRAGDVVAAARRGGAGSPCTCCSTPPSWLRSGDGSRAPSACSKVRTRRPFMPGWPWFAATNGCWSATCRRPARGPGGRSMSVRSPTRPPPPSGASRRPEASSWRARSSKGWCCSTRPASPRSRGSSIRCPPASSIASSSAPCRGRRSTISPRNGRKPWSDGAVAAPSEASTVAVVSTAPRSSGCGGLATRPRRRLSPRAMSCALTSGASSGGRCPSSGGSG